MLPHFAMAHYISLIALWLDIRVNSYLIVVKFGCKSKEK
jgi:hypothetical protein